MIVPLVVAVPGLLACAAIGWALDRALGWQLARSGAIAWATRSMAGVVVLGALALHPLFLVGLAVIVWMERRLAAPHVSRTESARGALAVLGGAAAVAALRPAWPLFWDEHVWLAKARLAATAPLALRAASLDPSADLVPRGYPIVASLAESLFALGRADVGSLVAGATALVLLSVGVALAAIPAERRVAWALALATVPLVWVHLRSAYLDLTIGMLALAVAAALLRAREGERGLPLACLGAFLLAGSKDEGLAHALAIAAAHAISSDDRRRGWREGALVAGAALVAAIGWRVLLATHGVDARDHALEGAGLSRAGAIGAEVLRAMLDVTSWGAGWALVLGAAVAALAAPRGRARGLALALVLSAAALTAGLLLGGERLRAFVLAGTVANRMLVQLVPLGALLVVEALAAASAARDASARPRALTG